MLALPLAEKSPMGQIPPPRSPLARRLTLALATMLLPVAAVAAAGLVPVRLSIFAAEEFRQETVEESKRIRGGPEPARSSRRPGRGRRRGERPGHGQAVRRAQRADRPALRRSPDLGHAAEASAGGGRRCALWEKSAADIEAAKTAPKASATDDRLDPFHDHIDQAASKLADLHSLNGNQVAEEISSLRRREQAQLLAGLRESEQRFRALVHHASDVFTVIGADGVIRPPAQLQPGPPPRQRPEPDQPSGADDPARAAGWERRSPPRRLMNGATSGGAVRLSPGEQTVGAASAKE